MKLYFFYAQTTLETQEIRFFKENIINTLVNILNMWHFEISHGCLLVK